MNVTIAADFENLLPAHSPEELAQLEVNLLRDPDSFPPVAVWSNHGNTILDGHNQYKLRKKHRMKIVYSKHEFVDRMSAQRWALEQQLGRRNMTASQLAMFVAKFPAGKPGPNNSAQKCAELSRTEMAAKVGVSERAVSQAAKVQKSGAKAVIGAIETGNIALHDAAAVAHLPKSEQTTALKKVRSGKSKTLRDATDFDPEKLEKQSQRRNGKPSIGRKDRDAAHKHLGGLIRALKVLDIYEEFVKPLSAIAERLKDV